MRPAIALAVSVCWLGGPGLAAPPGELPFGVFDPEGQFSEDPEVTIEHVFLPWQDVSLTSLLDADLYAVERKRALLITIEPWTWTRDQRNTPEYLRTSITRGQYDPNMIGICKVIATLQSPVSLRWAHEMESEDGQFIWSNWNPEDYIAAYRRMTDLCRTEAPNINLVWSPIGHEGALDYYPGDDYVDLVGLSIFGLQPWEQEILGGERSFEEILTERYDRVKELGKPVLVAELGYSGKVDYIDLWESQVRQVRPEMPLLVGVVYFNQPEVYPWPDGYGFPDWRVDFRALP